MEHLTPIHEVNPYASPLGGGEYGRELEEVGIWCDGDLMVMHVSAHLPPICIETGEPATHTRRYDLAWHYPLDWSQRTLRLKLPLCEKSFQAYRRWWRVDATLGATSILLALLALMYWGKEVPSVIVIALVAFSLGGCLLFAASQWRRGMPLRFVRVRGKHLWLKGAGDAFLRQLPPWIST